MSTSGVFALHVEGFVPREKPRFLKGKIASLGITDNSRPSLCKTVGLPTTHRDLFVKMVKRAKFCNQSTDFFND